MGRLQGFGGHVSSLMKTHRGLAQMTKADYEVEVKKCGVCGKRIALSSGRKYCRIPCSQIARGKNSKRLQKAFLARGEWVDFKIKTHAEALAIRGHINGGAALFQACLNRRVLSIRYTGVA